MSLRNTQKPLRELLSGREVAATIVATPAGMQPSSVITATYTAHDGETVIVSNKAGNLGALSPTDGTSLQPVDGLAFITHDHLLKVGECANCSSDLYADNATADTMQEHAHSGACVMCGSPVSYTNSGELAQIATSVEREEPAKVEVANHFDFSALSTVDPNTVEENDMSNDQARAVLRAAIASAIGGVLEKASDDDTVAVVPSEEDESDFAESDEDGDADLEVMDMDESDEESEEESEDDDSEEEASVATDNVDNAPVAKKTAVEQPAEVITADENTDAVVETPAVETPAEVASEEAPAAEVITTEDAPAAVEETAEAAETVETPVEVTTEAPADEVATIDDAATDNATIEYVATTPAELSPDAEFVSVSETAYYLVQNDAPVAVLRKENASAGAQSLWNKPVELRNAYRASLSGDRTVALAQLGGKILTHSTNVAAVVAERIATRETAAVTEFAAERASQVARFRQCLEVAALGINKGMFGGKFTNPVAAELANVLNVNGVREPQAIVRASMIQSMPSLLELVLEKAMELNEQSEDSLAATANLVGTAEFVAPLAIVPTAETAAPAVITPVVEVAAPVTKPTSSIAAMLTSKLSAR